MLILAAAFAAGVINSICGGGTLLTFPALLWTGMDPIIANATNTVALWPGTIAALVARRGDLQGNSRPWITLGIPSIAGGLLGALVLIHTPPQVFRFVAPGLMFFASLILGAQELLSRNVEPFSNVESEPSTRGWILVAAFQFPVAIYGGYFGAGIGILTLAVLGLAGLSDLHRMIALRVFSSACVNGAAAIYFSLFSPIAWRTAAIMAIAQIAGNWIGASTSRNLNATLVRRSIVAFGLAMAALLLRWSLSSSRPDFSLHLVHSHNTQVYEIPVYLDPASAQAKAAGRK